MNGYSAPRPSRQEFLRGATLLAAGALLGGCRSTSSSTPDPVTTTTAVRARDWHALADTLTGRVTLPSDRDFGAAKAVFNSRFDGSAPAAVAIPASVDDVRHIMRFAADTGVRVAARAGGHSYIGDSAAADALVVDLRRLPGGVTYDGASQRVTIRPANDLASVQATLDRVGRGLPTGSCPTVGVAGLTLGGGLGADARASGLTCDALISATMVLPGGDVVVASREDHADLYWALRGGGGGHFGIATSLTFRTHPTADRDVVTLAFPEDLAAQCVSGWRTWIAAADRSVWSMVNLTASDAGLRCSIMAATAVGDGPAATADLVSSVGAPPLEQHTRTLTHADFVAYFSGGAAATTPRAVVAGSDIIGELTGTAADSIVAAVSSRSVAAGSATVVLESLTGAIRDTDPADTAFPWRRQDACLQWYTEPPADEAEAALDWLTTAHRTVQPHSVGGYVNYVESGMPAARYFARNLDRLTSVRRRYDPDTLMYSSVGY
jgi:FAD/FMN-containing dehydrogenase